jgi:hypothetical protein
MRRSASSILSLVAIASAFAANPAWAILASDIASNSIYDDGWQNGDDGGTGFGPWALTKFGPITGHFMGNSLNLHGPGFGADINTSSRSFGMFAQHTDGFFEPAFAERVFDAPLSVGEAFSLEIAVNFRNGNKGVDVLRSDGGMLFNFNVGDLGGVDDYKVQFAASGNGSIGNTYHEVTEFKLTFVQTSASGGTWSIARSGGVTDFDTGTYAGGAVGAFRLYVHDTIGGGSANDLYANSFIISAIPEASAVWLGALASTACSLAWCWRRWQA